MDITTHFGLLPYSGYFSGGKIFVDMEILRVHGKNVVVSCTRALMGVARCIYMVTVSWINISWFTSQPRKPRNFNPRNIPVIRYLSLRSVFMFFLVQS